MMSEQLKRRLDRVESAEMVTADDARRERIDIKMQAHLSGIMQAHERGEDYLTDLAPEASHALVVSTISSRCR